MVWGYHVLRLELINLSVTCIICDPRPSNGRKTFTSWHILVFELSFLDVHCETSEKYRMTWRESLVNMWTTCFKINLHFPFRKTFILFTPTTKSEQQTETWSLTLFFSRLNLDFTAGHFSCVDETLFPSWSDFPLHFVARDLPDNRKPFSHRKNFRYMLWGKWKHVKNTKKF